jgi:hypothetical protein
MAEPAPYLDSLKLRYSEARRRIIDAGEAFERRAKMKLAARRTETLHIDGTATGALWNGAHPLFGPQSAPTFLAIIATVARITGTKPREITGPSKLRRIVRARQIAMYFMFALKDENFSEVGRRCGRRDHTTAMHGVNKVKARPEEFEPWLSLCAAELGRR